MLRHAAARLAPRASSRGLVTVTLPDLPYDFGALAPVISGDIMQLHHSKHHAAYVANFNAAAQQYAEAEAKGDLSRMIALQPALKFNGGGAWPGRALSRGCGSGPRARAPWRRSHPPVPRPRQPQPLLAVPLPAQGAWPTPPAAGPAAEAAGQEAAPPTGALLAAITRDFGSVDALVKKMSAAAVGVQGSGWAVRGR